MPKPPPADPPAPSDAELELLKLLWKLGPTTVRDLHGVIEEAGLGWAYTTVQTMLLRMAEKGYVAVDRDGFAHIFSAAVSRDSLVGLRLRDVMEKLCDGAAAPLLHHLAEGRKFSADEIAQFRKLLDDAERSGKGKRKRGGGK